MKKEYYIFQKNKVVHSIQNTTPLPFSKEEVDVLTKGISPLLLEEIPRDKGIYIVDLPENIKLPDGYETVSLRAILGWVEEPLFAAWGRAAQLLHWNTSNKYCGNCGTVTILHDTDPARFCPQCSKLLYPAISPCIIVLIHRGEEILLARSPRFRRSMFSTLAGFVEPGESAEQTLHREIYEEVRVKVKNVRYFSSQFWPFPGQLMLGFFAEYKEGSIRVDGEEISDADWFHCNDLPEIPISETIAGQLIRSYVQSIKEAHI